MLKIRCFAVIASVACCRLSERIIIKLNDRLLAAAHE